MFKNRWASLCRVGRVRPRRRQLKEHLPARRRCFVSIILLEKNGRCRSVPLGDYVEPFAGFGSKDRKQTVAVHKRPVVCLGVIVIDNEGANPSQTQSSRHRPSKFRRFRRFRCAAESRQARRTETVKEQLRSSPG